MVTRMTREELDTMIKTYGSSDRLGTHWAECWKSHVYCALIKAMRELDLRMKEESNG